MSEVKPPMSHPTITVDINDWMNERRTRGGATCTTNVTVDDLIDEAEERQAQWLHRKRMVELETLLAEGAHECSDCGKVERFYKDDYMCYQCRDRMEQDAR